MPLLRNKYQPYFPDTDAPNNYQCGSESYCHPVMLGDTIKSQFYQTPCGSNLIDDTTFSDYTLGPELITNGDFATNANGWVTTPSGNPLPSSDWSWNAGGYVEKIAGNDESLVQTGMSMVVGEFHLVEFDLTRTAGAIQVVLGDASGETLSAEIDTSGTYSIIMLFNDVLDNQIRFQPTDTTFAGSIDNVSVKQLTYTNWNANGSWVFEDGLACHVETLTGDLEEAVADYITPNEYYKLYITASGVVAGSVDVKIANVTVGTITSDGEFSFWGTPTLTGVVSFTPTSDFIGCLSAPDLRLLRNDYSGDVVDSDGNRYSIDSYFSYYEDWVTLNLNIEVLEVPYGCYYLEVFDSCLITGNNLVTNGTFAAGDSGWTNNNGGQQYSYAGGELDLIFEPIEGSNLITNGDFATGDFTSWTAGANWAVVGNKARHTPGSTATLAQALTLSPLPAPPTAQFYWIQFTISNWTTGTLTVNFGSKTKTITPDNNVIVLQLTPPESGSVNFDFTPSSGFDGDIDDVGVFISNTIWSGSPLTFNAPNTLMVAGNYEVEFEIIGSTDSRISVGMSIQGATQSVQYFSTVGTHTVTLTNYVPGAQRAYLVGNFSYGGYIVERTITVDNVVVRRVKRFDATYTSECLNYQLEQPRTKMIKAWCDQPAFGFEFDNTGFTLQQRAVVRSIAPNYQKDKQIQKSGNGDARVVYASNEKYWQLHTDFASETFHDAMAVMVDCDHFGLGEAEDVITEYLVTPEDYQPNWQGDGSYSLAPAVLTLRLKEQAQKFNRHL